MELREKAIQLLKDFKKDDYVFGLGKLDEIGRMVHQYGKSALVVSNTTYLKTVVDRVIKSLDRYGIKLAGGTIVPDAKLNSPTDDVYRIETYILQFKPDFIIAIGGGSTIDAVKAANVLASLGQYSPEIESYFGTGLVSKALEKTEEKLKPLIAIQTAASSGSHLTKYANVTNHINRQKKLIVDEAIVPVKALFDYQVTISMPSELTMDGALDGIAHCLEVFEGINEKNYSLVKEIALIAIELVIRNCPLVLDKPDNLVAREAIGLATDLGGYAIMVGSTNGAHLTSYSLVDICSHGRACAIMNPYYTVFFAPAIEEKLRLIGGIYQKSGFIKTNLDNLFGRDLGIAIAEGMISFNKSIGCPTTLAELPGFTEKHMDRALSAAKDPQLDMKLKNMPVPLNSSLVDEYMKPILEAAKTGDFSLIRNMN
ncbi:MAG: iron-containing alcohol dehydrogenase [Candidatus Caldatribacteriota bacterium]